MSQNALAPWEAPKDTRTILTPEGVPVHMRLASRSMRVIAALFDALLIFAIVLSMTIIAVAAMMIADVELRGYTSAAFTLLLFLVRNFYFTFFELRWRGRTPAKRLLHMRVIDASGGILRAEAIFVRNLTRDLELFLPLVLIFGAEQFWPAAPLAAQLFAGIWALLIGLMPLFNADRLRLGDLLAGTIVVTIPQVQLLGPVEQEIARRGRYDFSAEQLDMYGVYELQILEDFLRQYPDEDALRSVAEKIVFKIGFEGAHWSDAPRVFLDDFYHALRLRREQRLLFGDRQEVKKQGRLTRR